MFTYVTSYIDRVNVSFAKLQMASDLGFSDAVFGFGAGIFFAGYVLFEVPSNMILQRVGARWWITRIILSWGIVSSLMAFVTTPMQFYVMRFLLGVAEAGFIPAVVYYISKCFPSNRRARILSIFYTGLAMAGLIGSPLTGFIMQYFDGWMNQAGWKWVFLIEALPAFLAAALVYITLEDDVTRSRKLNEADRALLKRVLAKDSAAAASTKGRSLISSWVVWTFCFIYFLDVFAIYGYTFWVPTMLKDMGIKSDLMIGVLAALPNACAVVAMILSGRSADKRSERRWHVAALIVMGAAGLGLSVLYRDNVWLGVLALCIANAGMLSVPPIFWSMPTAFLGSGVAAVGIAWISSFGNLAGFFGPYVVGYLKQLSGGMNLPIYVMIGCLMVCAMLVLILPARLVNR